MTNKFIEKLEKSRASKRAIRFCLKLGEHCLNAISVKSTKVNSIYVINLDSRPERFASFSKKLSRCKIPVKRVQAVAGTDFDSSYLSKYAPEAPVPLSKGQVACYHSHKKCWGKMLNSTDQIVWILEDDARLNHNYAKHLDIWLQDIEQKDPNWEMIYSFRSSVDHFYTQAAQKRIPFISVDERQYDLPFTKHSVICGPSLFLSGYLISRKGAENLLKICAKIREPLDIQIPLNRDKIRMYAFSPPISYTSNDGITDSR